MAKAKAVESKDTKEKILALVPAVAGLTVHYTQTVKSETEGAPDVVNTTARAALALALCENDDGEQYVRALTFEDVTAFGIEGFEVEKVAI